MSNKHLDSSILRQLARLALPEQRLIEVICHLAYCADCRDAFVKHEPLLGPQILESAFDGRVRAGFGEDIMQKIQQVVTMHVRLCKQEDEEAVHLLGKLIAVPPQHREIVVRNQSQFHKLGLVRRLNLEVRGLWRRDTVAAAELAALAVSIAEDCLAEEAYPANMVADIRVLSRVFLGNSMRAQRQFDEASLELSKAAGWLEQIEEPGNLEVAWLNRTRSALSMDLQDFPDAKRDVEAARQAFFRARQDREALAMVVAEANLLLEWGKPEDAAALLESWDNKLSEEALGEIYFFTFCHLKALILTRLSRVFEARQLIPSLRKLASQLTEWKFSAHMAWLEALLHQGLGQQKQALESLRLARDTFLARGLWADAAMVMLEMAELALRQGRTQEAREVAAEAGPVLAAHGIAREAFMALQVFVQAARREAATLEVVAQAQQQVKAARLRPASDS